MHINCFSQLDDGRDVIKRGFLLFKIKCYFDAHIYALSIRMDAFHVSCIRKHASSHVNGWNEMMDNSKVKKEEKEMDKYIIYLICCCRFPVYAGPTGQSESKI